MSPTPRLYLGLLGSIFLVCSLGCGSKNKHVAPVEGTGDDHGNDRATATVLQLDQPAEGHIESSGDTDYFAVDLVAGTSYRFQTFDLGANSDTVLIWYDPSGTELWRNDDQRGRKPQSMIGDVAATVDGAHYLEVRQRTSGVGTYKLVGEVIANPLTDPDQLPDLVISSVGVMGSYTVPVGGFYNVGVVVENKGPVPTQAPAQLSVDFVREGGGGVEGIGTREIPALNPGQTWQVTLSANASQAAKGNVLASIGLPGTHLDESNIFNNTRFTGDLEMVNP